MAGNDRLLKSNNLVRAKVGVEVRLRIGEEDDGAVRSSATKLAARLGRRREGNGVVEGQPERLVSLLSTLVVEEVLDDVVPDGEEGAAGCIRRGVLAVGARNAAGEGSYNNRSGPLYRAGT